MLVVAKMWMPLRGGVRSLPRGADLWPVRQDQWEEEEDGVAEVAGEEVTDVDVDDPTNQAARCQDSRGVNPGDFDLVLGSRSRAGLASRHRQK